MKDDTGISKLMKMSFPNLNDKFMRISREKFDRSGITPFYFLWKGLFMVIFHKIETRDITDYTWTLLKYADFPF